jgi:hypothetical protein
MTFELRNEPGPPGLAGLGERVELVELPYGQMREAMAAGDKPGQSADRLLSVALHVDGQPVGYDALLALPGRFSGGIAAALEQCLRMHGLADAAGPDADDPKG